MILHDDERSTHAMGAAADVDWPDVAHWSCCVREVALCDGHDLSDGDEMGEAEDPDCVVCNELLNEAPHFCPVRAFCLLYTAPV